jgi:hypothetical protein
MSPFAIPPLEVLVVSYPKVFFFRIVSSKYKYMVQRLAEIFNGIPELLNTHTNIDQNTKTITHKIHGCRK